MSAIIGRFGYPSRDGKDPGLWIKNQPAFYLHENLTLENLKAQLAEAHSEDSAFIYVKNPGKGNGHTRLDVWYVEAIIPQLERNR